MKALVLPMPGRQHGVDAASFSAWCREPMAVCKVPRRVEHVAALPKSGTGKILWRELQQAHQDPKTLTP